MSPRIYDTALRAETEAATRRRIVLAAVELHAQKGPLGTTHADIAELAGVSVATVYKHFPSRDALVPHCTSHVEQQGPEIDLQALLAQPADARLGGLVAALHAQYRYFHPWLRWAARDAAALPALMDFLEQRNTGREMLIRAVLDSVAGTPVSEEAFAQALVVLDYSAWRQFDRLLHDPHRVSLAAEHILQILMSAVPKSNERKK